MIEPAANEPYSTSPPPPTLPSSPAADANQAPRWWRSVVRASLARHLKRSGIVAGGVLLVGAVVSGYLSEVGLRQCAADGACIEYRFYPFTAQLRSVVHTLTADGEERVTWRREWYPSGGVWIEGAYEDGQRTGPWRERWPDGTLRFEGTYKHGALDGVETWYYPGGQMEWQIGRVAGRRDGEERWWHDNGELRRIGSYRDGERHGSFTVYGLHGEIAFSGEYRHGEVVAGQRVD